MMGEVELAMVVVLQFVVWKWRVGLGKIGEVHTKNERTYSLSLSL